MRARASVRAFRQNDSPPLDLLISHQRVEAWRSLKLRLWSNGEVQNFWLLTTYYYFTQHFQCLWKGFISCLLFMMRVTTSSCCSDSIRMSHLAKNHWLKAAEFGVWAEMQHSCSSLQSFIMTFSKRPSADVCVCHCVYEERRIIVEVGFSAPLVVWQICCRPAEQQHTKVQITLSSISVWVELATGLTL